MKADIWILVGLMCAALCGTVIGVESATDAPKKTPVTFRGVPLTPDSTMAEVYHDPAKAAYVRMILKDNGNGSLTSESGHLLFIASPAWADSTKRQAILMMFRAQEVLQQATEALRK